MDSVLLDFTKIDQAGQDIKKSAKTMADCLEDVRKIMKDSKRSYDSDSGDKLRQNFERVASKFNEFKTQMDAYGDFLIKEAAARQDSDNKVGQRAEIASIG